MSRTFEDLVAEAEAAPVEGWDFSWLRGRAEEQRPSWGYQRLMSERLGGSRPRSTSRPAAGRSWPGRGGCLR